MKRYSDGVADEQARVIALLDNYDITELLGGAILLQPKVEPVDKSWKGQIHQTGSTSSYWRRGCRCVTCKSFASDYQRERRLVRKGLK